MKKTVIIICNILILFASCTNEQDGLGGDTIKLSTSHLEFNNQSGSQTIISQSEFWSIINIEENDVIVPIPNDINLSDKEIVFQGDWYLIKRENKKITFTVTENIYKNSRKLHIRLQDRNWFGSTITLVQKGNN